MVAIRFASSLRYYSPRRGRYLRLMCLLWPGFPAKRRLKRLKSENAIHHFGDFNGLFWVEECMPEFRWYNELHVDRFIYTLVPTELQLIIQVTISGDAIINFVIIDKPCSEFDLGLGIDG